MKLNRYVFRRRGESDEDKWLYVKSFGRDVIITTPFIEEAEAWNWHDKVMRNIPKAYKRHYLK